MKHKLLIGFLMLAAFVAGYYFPRAHYTITDDSNGFRLCAVQANGSKACTHLEGQGWIPLLPSWRVRP